MIYVLGAVSLLLGVLFVLPVGGADVPIVISLLNAATGVAVAASGFVLDNVLLLDRRNLGRCQRNAADAADGQGDGTAHRVDAVRRASRVARRWVAGRRPTAR